MDRLERLVNLVVALLDTRRPLTREEIRERVGGYAEAEVAFRRAFERDKELLRQMGIPVLAEHLGSEEGQVGYWVPRELYEMPDPGLTEEEMMALSLAASLVAFQGEAPAGEGSSTVTSALRKLAGAPEAPGPVFGFFERSLVGMPLEPALATIFAALSEKRTLGFSYGGVERRTDPYRLSFREGRWYLSGFDHARGAERLYRVDRIEGPVELASGPGAFERPAAGAIGGPPPPWRLGNDLPVTVELRVDRGQAVFVRRLAGEEAVSGTGPAGEVYLRLEVTNRAGFRSFVLGLLDHAEVLSPPEVREEIVGWLEAIAGKA
jgi:predicted DNA-binding transcriptional regulator YafY